jgi:hypothetical protein
MGGELPRAGAFRRLARAIRRLGRAAGPEDDRPDLPVEAPPKPPPRQSATVARLSGAPFRIWRRGVLWRWETDAKVGGDHGAALSLKRAQRAARAAIRSRKAGLDRPPPAADQDAGGQGG